MITAPLGAILINTLGTKLLNYDGPPQDQIAENLEQPVTKRSNKIEHFDAEGGAISFEM